MIDLLRQDLAVAVLALGIAAASISVSVANALFVRQLPIAATERFVHVYRLSEANEPFPISYPAYEDVRELTQVFDAGAPELPLGNFGGLRPRPSALAAAMRWKPEDDMKVDRVCLPPSIVYSMQGPFPMEIHQGTDLIVMRLEYYDMVRIIFIDGRPHPAANAPHTKVGHSVGRWDGATLVVDTTHLSESTITNNGLNHSDSLHLIERFWLSPDGKMLLMQQEFEDPEALENRGARFVGWDRGTDFIYPYECDPSFAANYDKK